MWMKKICCAACSILALTGAVQADENVKKIMFVGDSISVGVGASSKETRYTTLAVKMLMPVEDILYKGEFAELKHNNPSVNVTAWKLGKEYAVFVRNYDSGKVRTTLEIPAGMKVYDTLTGKEVSATVELDALRVKVLKIK